MPTATSKPDPETSALAAQADLAQAEADAADAEKLAATLEQSVLAGDTTVTPEQLTSSGGLLRFARLRVEATLRKAEEAKVAARAAAIRTIRDEVAASATSDSDAIVAAYRSAHTASVDFFTIADEHNARLRSWRERLEALGVADGTIEEGVGLNGIHEVVLGGTAMAPVEAARYLNMLFTGQADANAGQLTPADIVDGSRIQAAIDALQSIGLTK